MLEQQHRIVLRDTGTGITWHASIGPVANSTIPANPGSVILGRLKDSRKFEPGPLVKGFWHVNDDGSYWIELAVLNGVIEWPFGTIEGEIAILREKAGPLVRHPVFMPDGTGCTWYFGWPRYVASPTPPGDWAWDERMREPGLGAYDHVWPDADPHKDTHQVGSPRNKLWSPTWALHASFPDKHAPAEWLVTWVQSQVGFYSEQAKQFVPGRPYHYFHADGRPYQANDPIVDQGTDRPPVFGEQGVQRQSWIDTLGRKNIPPERWHPSQTTSFEYEHMECEELFAACRLVGSTLARDSIELLGNCALSQSRLGAPTMWNKGWYHSDRTGGWCPRLMVRIAELYAMENETDQAKAWLTVASDVLQNVATGAFHRMTGWGATIDKLKLPQKHLLSRSHNGWWALEENPKAQVYAACWQLGVLGSTAFAAARLAEILAVPSAVLTGIGTYAAECISYCYAGESGLWENYELAQTPISFSGNAPTLQGTASWPWDCVARALIGTGDEERFGWIRSVWAIAKDLRADGQFQHRSGGTFYRQWDAFLAANLNAHEWE